MELGLSFRKGEKEHTKKGEREKEKGKGIFLQKTRLGDDRVNPDR